MPGSQFPDEKMGVEISEQKHGLKEHEAGQPDMGSAAEIGGQQATESIKSGKMTTGFLRQRLHTVQYPQREASISCRPAIC